MGSAAFTFRAHAPTPVLAAYQIVYVIVHGLGPYAWSNDSHDNGTLALTCRYCAVSYRKAIGASCIRCYSLLFARPHIQPVN